MGLEDHPAGVLGLRLKLLDFSRGLERKLLDVVNASPFQIEMDGTSGSVWIKAHQ
jgi:hypothetical protein